MQSAHMSIDAVNRAKRAHLDMAKLGIVHCEYVFGKDMSQKKHISRDRIYLFKDTHDVLNEYLIRRSESAFAFN